MTTVVMPKLGLIMEKGIVVKWLKEEGEKVEKGEPLAEVETEKTIGEVESPATGVLHEIIAREGTEIPVGEPIAVIAALGEELPPIEVKAPKQERAKESMVPRKEVVTVERRILASPAAKRVAKEQNVKLSRVVGTGPRGRVVEKDVKKYIEEMEEGAKVKVVQMTEMRKAIARHLSKSYLTAVHSTITMEFDVSECVKLRQKLIEEDALHLSYTDMMVKSVAKALEDHPILNSKLEDEQILLSSDINIGIAVATKTGLVVPVIRDANKKTLSEIASTSKQLIEKTRKGKALKEEELTCGTFTITNLGMYDVEVFTPIINFPEVAILGMGKIKKKQVVRNGGVAIRSMMMVNLSFDHRVLDGVLAAQFLMSVKQILESSLRQLF